MKARSSLGQIGFLGALALLVCAFSDTAGAAAITVQIGGVIDFHSPTTGFWDGTVVDNVTPYSFSLTFDSNALDTDSDPTIGTYNSSGPTYQMSISFGDYTFTTTGTTVTVWNDFFNGFSQQDGIFFSNLNAFTQNGLTLSQNGLQANLFFSNTSFLSSDSLSGVQTYPVTDFSTKYMLLSGFFNNGGGNQPASLQGTIDSFAVIPEPSPALLLLTGGVLIAAFARARSSRVS